MRKNKRIPQQLTHVTVESRHYNYEAGRRRRHVAALARFTRWEKQFAQYGAPCDLGMKLSQQSIGAF